MFLKFIGSIIAIFGLGDILLSFIGIDIYAEMGIILPGWLYMFTGIIAMVVGSVIYGMGVDGADDDDKEKIITDIAQPNINEFTINNRKIDFSQKGIQEVLDIFITETDAGSIFIFSISGSENIYAQGAKGNQNDDCILEISSKMFITNPEILDKQKYKKLVLLGWKMPDDIHNNFYCEVTVKDILEDKVAKLLFESLKVFDLSTDQIDFTCSINPTHT